MTSTSVLTSSRHRFRSSRSARLGCNDDAISHRELDRQCVRTPWHRLSLETTATVLSGASTFGGGADSHRHWCERKRA